MTARRWPRRLVVAGAVAAAGLVGVTATSVALRGDPPLPSAVLGVYSGYTDVHGVHRAASLLGRPLGQAMDFFDGTGWETLVRSPANVVPAWEGMGYRMTWGVPMLPDTGASLEIGATGAYDHYFAAVARYLVAHGQGSSFVRLGWEFNGSWFSWSASRCPRCFVAYWRHIVTTMRTVPGAHFRFEWNPMVGTNSLAPPRAWPGRAYVDVVGLDVYDNVPGVRGTAARWHRLMDEPYGLNWVVAFARAHHEPLAFPEWGLGYGPGAGGDDPAFVTEMAGFLRSAPDLVSAIYWDYGSSALATSPRAAAALRHALR